MFKNLVIDFVYLYVIFIHLIATYQDIRAREINDFLWLAMLPVTVFSIIYVLCYMNYLIRILYIIDLIFGLTIAAICFFFRLTGGADVKSITLLTLTLIPYYIKFPVNVIELLNLPIISIMINTFIISTSYIIYNIVRNVKTFNKCNEKSRLSKIYTILYICVPVSEIIKKPHVYSLIQYFDENCKRYTKFRISIEVEDPRELIVKYIERNCISVKDYILASYNIPMILCITISLIIYYITKSNVISIILTLA